MTSKRIPAELAPPPVYYARLRTMLGIALAMMSGWLAIGTVGYHLIDDFPWLDAFHQSSMLLAGMGPVKEINTVAGKLFDSFYALLSALIILGAAGILFAPIFHRILHRFHLEDAGGGE
jgi:hypothetical protein